MQLPRFVDLIALDTVILLHKAHNSWKFKMETSSSPVTVFLLLKLFGKLIQRVKTKGLLPNCVQ